jgi:hypothetical protein
MRRISLLLIMLASPIVAQENIDVDVKTHIDMIIKSLGYDFKCSGGTVLVIFRNQENENGAKAVDNLSGKSIKNNTVEIFQTAYVGKSSLDPLIAANIKINIIYLCDDLLANQLKEISAFCIQNKIITATGVSNFVEKGYACLSVTLENDKPKLVVNLNTMREEGHQFSASYLKMAKIIQ